MKWHKLGRIYAPDGTISWARSYAAFPTVDLRQPGVIRVYVTSLDEQKFGRGGFVDLDASDPLKIIGMAHLPILDLGPIGDFDDAGANPFSVITFGGRRYCYYQGWQRTLRAPYAIFTGLAIEDEHGVFQRSSRLPVLERTEDEPHIRGAPFIIAENDKLRMWYVSSGSWTYRGSELHYHVKIRHASSSDGVRWAVTPGDCIVPADGEYGVGRPVVLHDGGRYRMWYSVRSFERPYAMGYAESDDGFTWERQDHKVGVSRSGQGWDSEMLCYGYVLRLNGQLVMFYNGNQHGATGFGYAVCESE